MKKPVKGFDGAKLVKARIKNSLTQKELALKLDVSQPLVSNWEKNKLVPSTDDMKKLQSVFGTFWMATVTEDKVSKGDSEVSPIAVWLNKARNNNNLTVAELSQKSGVAIPTIYAIESGKIVNPRDITIRQLEKSLNEAIPQETKEEIKEESTVEGVGEIEDFNPYDTGNLPDVGGVYVFYDISNRPIYVGKAKKIETRVKQHSDKFWFKAPIVTHAMYIKIEEEKLRAQIEKILIKFMKDNAVLNVQNVDRDSGD